MKYLQREIGIYCVEGYLSDNFEVGITLQDLLDGKYILMSQDQEAFAEQHRNADVFEICLMRMYEAPEVPVLVKKQMKIAEIEAYDKSTNVNCFYVGGVAMWLDRNTRTSLRATIEAYKAYSQTDITLWTEGANPIAITMSIENFEQLLISLEMYAKACFDTTAVHKANIHLLSTNEQIDNYSYVEGYPEKLTIMI